ncbi:aldo/keto reductase [Rothia sp. ZJ932]|uniref:aldo/keto reductase n=1 Tax=Rothia sp. ZJ932 TaxID=2810516 RepID=UPI0019681B91|nr:aldo/keto reductase [Rothia sp. ZJ932]QRZ61097.1 aldo/keto reductase [Rothia sp. ZJ932]
MLKHTLRDGKTIPAIGFGTYPLKNAEAEVHVSEALLRGWRLIDTAVNYGNEIGVGRGVNRSGIDRSEIFVQTKVPGRHHGFETTKASLKESLERLELDYVDMYLIHWPNPSIGKFVDTWRAMIELRDEGLTRSIGVSNFLPEHVDALIAITGETPAVNQIEIQPTFQQETQREYDRSQAMITQAWSPLGRGKDILELPAVIEIAREAQATPAQVVLRWNVQSNLLPIVKTANTERMVENLNIFEWELTEDQMNRLKMLHTGIGVFGYDPAEHEEM